jgi:hypothetical protein
MPDLISFEMHVYEVRPRKDKRGFDLVSDPLPFGRLWYAGQVCICALRLSNVFRFAKQPTHRDSERLRDCDCLIIHHVPLPILQLGNSGLRDLNAPCCQAARKVFLRNRWTNRKARKPDSFADHIFPFRSTSLFHPRPL